MGQDGLALLLLLGQELDHLRGRLGIEAGERLFEQQGGRSLQEGRREAELAHLAGADLLDGEG